MNLGVERNRRVNLRCHYFQIMDLHCIRFFSVL
jgi:hypothetical protein